MSFSMPTILPTMMTIRSYGKRVTCRGLPEDFHGNENGAVREIVNQNSMKRALVPFKSGWTSVTYGGNFIGTYFCGMVMDSSGVNILPGGLYKTTVKWPFTTFYDRSSQAYRDFWSVVNKRA